MRLTKKYKEDYFVNNENKELTRLDIENDHNSSQIIRNKLGQLEDIEDELGIDLATLFKALKNGAWFKVFDPKDIVFIKVICIGSLFQISGLYKDYRNDDRQVICCIEDYGKTWALTKEELVS